MFLAELCAEVRNYFETDKRFGDFTITGGTFAPPYFIKNGQYFRIVGSTFNDGIYQYPTTELKDESFNGAVWVMSVPPAFLSLADKIEKYKEKYEENPSPYTSESFGGYSYAKATDSNGAPISWQKYFAKSLNRWRKI